VGANKREEAVLTLRADPERFKGDASGLGDFSWTCCSDSAIVLAKSKKEQCHENRIACQGKHLLDHMPWTYEISFQIWKS